MRQLQKVGDKLMQSAMDMRIVLGEPGFRGNWREALQSGSIKRELLRLTDSLELAIDVLKIALGRSQLLDTAFERANLIKGRIDRYVMSILPVTHTGTIPRLVISLCTLRLFLSRTSSMSK